MGGNGGRRVVNDRGGGMVGGRNGGWKGMVGGREWWVEGMVGRREW